MAFSLNTATKRFAKDQFATWDPVTNTFSTATQSGRLFRIDRFTTIYHRPTRRSYISLLESWPASGVVKRVNGGEIILVGGAERQEIFQGETRYERLRQVHFATPPSGAAGVHHPATVSGTGEDLGFVSLTAGAPLYLDLELQGLSEPATATDLSIGRFLLTYSANVTLLSGDYVKADNRWFLVDEPYLDGGFRVARVREIDPAYEAFVYQRPSTSSYNPTTGVVTPGMTSFNVSGIVVSSEATADQRTAPAKLTVAIFKHHIGFAPRALDRMSYNGRTYQITKVERFRDNQQWRVTLEV